MYLNQVLANLVDLPYFPASQIEKDNTLTLLKNSQNFYLGDAEDLKTIGKSLSKDGSLTLFQGELGENIGLPFELTTFWVKQSFDGEKSCILAQRKDESLHVRYFFSKEEKGGKSWFLWPISDVVLDDGNVYPKYLGDAKEFQNIALRTSSRFRVSIANAHKEQSEKRWLPFLNLALMVLNCKNITYETVQPRKKKRKKGKRELFSYYVLNIAPTSNKRQVRSGATGTGDKKRVHLCRGHFKTFTEDAPLFGRYTGRFWWQPQVRGQDKSGIVHKDYNVEV
jgi:hypothetical protein